MRREDQNKEYKPEDGNGYGDNKRFKTLHHHRLRNFVTFSLWEGYHFAVGPNPRKRDQSLNSRGRRIRSTN